MYPHSNPIKWLIQIMTRKVANIDVMINDDTSLDINGTFHWATPRLIHQPSTPPYRIGWVQTRKSVSQIPVFFYQVNKYITIS